MFRRRHNVFEVLLGHPGGPFWTGRDVGAWTIPKGEPKPGEELLASAIREFCEETSLTPNPPYIRLGNVTQKSGKVVHAWAFEGDANPSGLRSNTFEIEWPRRSGKHLTIPEIDRYEWLAPDQALVKINPAQFEFIVRLGALLGNGDDLAPS